MSATAEEDKKKEKEKAPKLVHIQFGILHPDTHPGLSGRLQNWINMGKKANSPTRHR